MLRLHKYRLQLCVLGHRSLPGLQPRRWEVGRIVSAFETQHQESGNSDGESDLFHSDLGDEYHNLEERKWGEATLIAKPVKVCGSRNLMLGGEFRYPAFPADEARPWDDIQNGKWDGVARYWGNKSASCSDWSVNQLSKHDIRFPKGSAIRAKYQSTLFMARNLDQMQGIH